MSESERCLGCKVIIYRGGERGSGLCQTCRPKYGMCQYCGEGNTCHGWTDKQKSFWHIPLGSKNVTRITIWLCNKHFNSLDTAPRYQPIMRYDYIKETQYVVDKFKEGKISVDSVFYELEKIERIAHEAYPDAEPDGDITYCVASALEEITQLNSQKNDRRRS